MAHSAETEAPNKPAGNRLRLAALTMRRRVVRANAQLTLSQFAETCRIPGKLTRGCNRCATTGSHTAKRVPPVALRDLPGRWREQAGSLEHYGAPGNAATLRAAAAQLEAALRSSDDAPLTLAQAAAVSGYSEDHLARQLREQKIPNVGRPRAPRIRTADLPRKPRAIALAGAVLYDAGADARSLLAARLHHGGEHGE
jgi:hypothetical protein